MTPSITVVLPTYNSAATLELALASLAAQRYDGAVDVLCIDGGSADGTRALAERFGASWLENPLRVEEEGRAVGLEAAAGELVLFLDADDELPHPDWLTRHAAALELADDVVSADPLYGEWRASDRALTRLYALVGGTDPLAIELGFADRWAWHRGRWTGMPGVEEEDAGDALLVRIDPDRPPPMGSNGWLVRRSEVLRTQYRPFVHSDVVGDLAALGFRFARVKDGFVHHYADNLWRYAQKARRHAERAVRGEPPQRRGFRPSRLQLSVQAVSSIFIIGPSLKAIRGYKRKHDRAWALYPVISWLTTFHYGLAALRSITRRHAKTDL